jgi:Family of unknown function (DUF6496)
MAKQFGRQREIVGRVMHEFAHGELETQGRKVRNPRQAIAIGLSEAGASSRQSPASNRKQRAKTEDKERKGQTARQRKEGRRTAGPTASRAPAGKKAAAARRAVRGGTTRAQLYAEAKRRGLRGCSHMSKAELERKLRK